MIVVFTDFGVSGPYTGQMKAVLHRDAPGVHVVDLLSDAPSCDPMLSSYLLSAYADWFPVGTCFLCVVDPGVGSERAPGVLHADGKWFVGPDNGLFEIVARRASNASWSRISWRPDNLSNSFHGRDLFAPVAAAIAKGKPLPSIPEDIHTMRRPEWPDDLPRVVYIDAFGNVILGIRGCVLGKETRFFVGNEKISWARTFSEVPTGGLFWYENSNGLVEITANKSSAEQILSLGIGAEVSVGAGS
ncbi:MAG: SAM-dependent chlorinase/fluorinase [Rhodospirillales bacterium]|nr:SAM-dependent chlorinase/fluorinase [Rhodospirillales bacterium]